jgi:HK97 family phage prohead protease
MDELEYRATFETRAKDDGAGLSGYVSTFNKVDSYGTAFAPGSFTKTLQERGDKIPILYNHDPGINVGIPESLATDAMGLKVDAHIFDDGADGTTLSRRLRAGARYGLSFGFRTLRDRAAMEGDQLDMAQALDASFWDGIRVIEEVKLYEVSVVTFPANDAAQITAVRQTAMADALTALLDDLRENRLSDNEQHLVRQIVAAFPDSGPAGTTDPPEQRSTRRLDAEIALAQIRFLTPDVMGQRV